MSETAFRTVVKGLIERDGRFLVGQKEREEGHPISGAWHLLGGHLEHGEDVEEGLRREVREETGLVVDVQELVDVATFTWETENDSLQVLFHCTVESGTATARDDLRAVRWVPPEELPGAVHPGERRRLTECDRQSAFLERARGDR